MDPAYHIHFGQSASLPDSKTLKLGICALKCIGSLCITIYWVYVYYNALFLCILKCIGSLCITMHGVSVHYNAHSSLLGKIKNNPRH